MIKLRRMRWAVARPRRRWEDNIKMDLTEIDLQGVDWDHLAQDRGGGRALTNTIMNLWVQ
jgi:hypothetical protein